MAWTKLHTDILGDPKLMRAARKGSRELVFLPWLFAFAKQADDGGRLSVGGEPADPVDISDLIPEATARRVALALDSLESIGVLVRDDDGALRFARWDVRSEAKPSDSPSAIAERVKRHRAKHRNADSNALHETPGNALHETPGNATEEKRGEEKRGEEKDGASAPPPDRSRSAVHPDAERVLAHHLELHPKQRPDRRAALRLIARRLASYTVEELMAASDGNARDEWALKSGNQGITHVLKDNAAVDKWRALATPRSSALIAVLPQSRGRVLLELFRRYDLFSYNGNQDEYVAKRSRAAADPAAGPDFIAECSAVKPWRDIPGDNDHFKAQEIEKRLAARHARAS